jgi:hypothetical protein
MTYDNLVNSEKKVNRLERIAVVYNQLVYLVGRVESVPLATDSVRLLHCRITWFLMNQTFSVEGKENSGKIHSASGSHL